MRSIIKCSTAILGLWIAFGWPSAASAQFQFQVSEPINPADLVYSYSDDGTCTIVYVLTFLVGDASDPCHVGIYTGLDSFYNVTEATDVVPGHSVTAVPLSSFERRGIPPTKGFRGSRTTYPFAPTNAQRSQIIAYLNAKKARWTAYPYLTLLHDWKGGYDAGCYWGNPSCWDGFDYFNMFDCVGLAESAYEIAGLDPLVPPTTTPASPGEEGVVYTTPRDQYLSPHMTIPSIQLTTGSTFTGSVKSKLWAFFYLSIPPGTGFLKISTIASGNVYLYAKQASFPTLSSFDCASTSNSSTQNCQIALPNAGIWAIGVYGYDTSAALPGSYTLSTLPFTLSTSYGPNLQISPLKITSSSLVSATVGTTYNQSLSASGGAPPYTWSVTAGSLPSGLTFSSSGTIKGVPTATGTYTFAIAVVDSSKASASASIQMTVAPASIQSSPTASTYHIFPQFADGKLSDGTSYRTTLMITNANSVAVSCTLQLRGLTVTGLSLNYSIPPGGWVISPSSDAQSLQSGYATLQCSSSVEAQLLYSFYSPTGVKTSEAAVFSSPAASGLQILADTRESARVGLAIANDTDQTTTYTVNAYDSSGALVGTSSVTLAARTSHAAFVDELMNIPVGYYGPVIVSSTSGTGSIIGLRYTGTTFTTIPETLRSSLGATARPYHVFPQVADGQLSDGSYYRTTLMIANPSASAGANCTLQLHGITVSGFASTYNLGPAGWAISATSGSQTLQTGYATLQCSASVEAQLLYSYYASNGTKLSEATVFSSPPSSTPEVLADDRGGAHLGLAIANDSDQPATYTVSAYDPNGNLIGQAVLTIAARSSRAAFVDQLINIPSGNYGQVLVSSGGNIAASIIGLRYTGGVFTTIPESVW